MKQETLSDRIWSLNKSDLLKVEDVKKAVAELKEEIYKNGEIDLTCADKFDRIINKIFGEKLV